MHQIDRRHMFKIAATLAVAGCAPRPMPGMGPGMGARFDFRLRPPQAGGMTRAGLGAVRATVQRMVDTGEISGAVSAVARRDALVWYEAQGFSDPSTRTPMQRDAIFRLMSSTKPVTAVAVLMMVDEGRLTLDDPVSRYIPSFANLRVAEAPPGNTDPAKVRLVPPERPVTIRDLLTHTSGITGVGLPGPTPAPGPDGQDLRIRPAQDTLASYIPRLGSVPLAFQPGSRFEYSPTAAPDVALRIVEIVSGQPADMFLRDRLFRPLDMRDTGFNLPADKQARVVPIMGKGADGGWEAKPHLFGAAPVTYFSGGGGLYGTVRDMLNFETMLLHRGTFNGRRIMRPETFALMVQDQAGPQFRRWFPPLTGGYDFGLLVRVARSPDNMKGDTVGTFGWGGAYGTESWAEPALDMVACFFLQMSPPSQTAATAFGKAVRGAIAG